MMSQMPASLQTQAPYVCVAQVCIQVYVLKTRLRTKEHTGRDGPLLPPGAPSPEVRGPACLLSLSLALSVSTILSLFQSPSRSCSSLLCHSLPCFLSLLPLPRVTSPGLPSPTLLCKGSPGE